MGGPRNLDHSPLPSISTLLAPTCRCAPGQKWLMPPARGRLSQLSLSCMVRPVRHLWRLGGLFLPPHDFSRCSAARTPSVHP